MNTNDARRPLKVRDATMMKQIASFLNNRHITPNQISLFSIIFAICGAICFISSAPLLAALCIQLRLLCNLFDGMVAIEGGKSTASGELFNDIPDRISDPLLLIAAGYAASGEGLALLGWLAGLLAIMTAYVRTLATSIGAPVNFSGPMAKQHRMALLTVASLLTATIGYSYHIIGATLTIIVIGCLITIYRRTMAAYTYLENQGNA